MTEPLSLLALTSISCQRLILVGDPLQLPPTLSFQSTELKTGLDRTLFERLTQGSLEPILLVRQYRVSKKYFLYKKKVQLYINY
jgi:superfamily I DNA and/or RNA helicase